jgi:hypothetical protein
MPVADTAAAVPVADTAALAKSASRCPSRPQRNWLAAGNGTRIPGQETRRLDLLGLLLPRHQIGHVMIIWNPANKTIIEACGTRAGVGNFSYAKDPSHDIFEIWRLDDIAATP